ncbi:AraC family transcriptional regulator [Gracilibacillus dipsosauri]|uniref:AraC family transcriptional regulator n=1 Tax=Gracilibacillus dipsosauri TaxID=178340 RepID=A0A317L1U7_9BACI|nr:AraC family transcriptional regulator [Gracilibacillus dipsosauri]PWU69493.1 AraC family transcriptional regulator [Gracilibacillus dipsosauri]
MKNFKVNYRLEGEAGKIKAHSHIEYEIYLFHKGTCRYLIHNQIYDLQPGDILLMDGLALHKPNVPINSEYIRSHVHFAPHSIETLLSSLNASSLLDVFHKLGHCLIRTTNKQEVNKLAGLIKQMSEINHEPMSKQEQEWELKALLVQVLIIVNRLGNTSSIKVISKKLDKTWQAERIATYIQQHFHEKLSIDKIATQLNLSKSYVSHVFKEMTGFTVMEYVMACRLKQVQYLLEVEERKTLQQIADESGFESVSHLSRFFKKQMGITAKTYRMERLKIFKE